MTNWLHRVDIKQHLNDGRTAEEFEQAKAGVVAELKKLPHYGNAGGLDGIIRDLEDAGDVDMFNDVLGELYDWADVCRVWLGL